MNLREKYGEWGIILGATEGVGKAFAEKIASEGMKCCPGRKKRRETSGAWKEYQRNIWCGSHGYPCRFCTVRLY